jgi:hypothetical protein
MWSCIFSADKPRLCIKLVRVEPHDAFAPPRDATRETVEIALSSRHDPAVVESRFDDVDVGSLDEATSTTSATGSATRLAPVVSARVPLEDLCGREVLHQAGFRASTDNERRPPSPWCRAPVSAAGNGLSRTLVDSGGLDGAVTETVRFRSANGFAPKPAWFGRRGRDLNPRTACTLGGFRDRLETGDLQGLLSRCASKFASARDSLRARQPALCCLFRNGLVASSPRRGARPGRRPEPVQRVIPTTDDVWGLAGRCMGCDLRRDTLVSRMNAECQTFKSRRRRRSAAHSVGCFAARLLPGTVRSEDGCGRRSFHSHDLTCIVRK